MKKLYSLTIVLSLCLFNSGIRAQDLAADSLALVSFYNTAGGSWDTTGTWLVENISNWYGVVVDSVDGAPRVVSFSTENLNPSGPVSAEIGKLSALKELKLIGDEDGAIGGGPVIIDLNGSLPSEIWDLTSLQKLQVKYTNITGGIPSGIESMVNLVEINFQQTYLGGSIPSELFELPALTKAYLHESDFTGTLPASAESATQLTRLYLHGNKLEGPLPFIDIHNTGAKITLTGNYFSIVDVKPYHDSVANIEKLTDDYQFAQDTVFYDTLYVGDSVTFAFEAPGAETYAWLKEGDTSPLSTTDTAYTINPLALSDVGTYTCHVQSSAVANFEVLSSFVIKNIVEKTSSVDKVTNTNDLVVYPNPFTSYININSSSAIKSVRIVDITGKQVFIRENLSGTSYSIPVQELNSGIYFISIESIDSTSVQKITKK